MNDRPGFTAVFELGADRWVGAAFARVLASMAARAGLDVGRIGDAAVIGDAVADRDDHPISLRASVHGDPGVVSLRVAPVDGWMAERLVDSSRFPTTGALLAQLADRVAREPLDDGREAVTIDLRADGTPPAVPEPVAVPDPPVRERAGFSVCLPAAADSVPLVRQALAGVAEALEITDEKLDDIRLAVSEACTNVIMHAYPGAEDVRRTLTVDVTWATPLLAVEVRDSGVGLGATAATDGPGMGLGMGLMTALSSTVSITSDPDTGTTVRLEFELLADASRA